MNCCSRAYTQTHIHNISSGLMFAINQKTHCKPLASQAGTIIGWILYKKLEIVGRTFVSVEVIYKKERREQLTLAFPHKYAMFILCISFLSTSFFPLTHRFLNSHFFSYYIPPTKKSSSSSSPSCSAN